MEVGFLPKEEIRECVPYDRDVCLTGEDAE